MLGSSPEHALEQLESPGYLLSSTERVWPVPESCMHYAVTPHHCGQGARALIEHLTALF